MSIEILKVWGAGRMESWSPWRLRVQVNPRLCHYLAGSPGSSGHCLCFPIQHRRSGGPSVAPCTPNESGFCAAENSFGLNALATWCEELTHWKRPWCWERLRAGGEGDDRGWDVGWHHQLNGHGFGWTPGVGDGQGAWRAAVQGVTEGRTCLSD